MISQLYDYEPCLNCETNVIFLKVNQDHHVFADVDEDSLSTQDMADIEDGKPLLFDEARHKRHVCREYIA